MEDLGVLIETPQEAIVKKLSPLENFKIWHEENYAAMKDALDSAFGEEFYQIKKIFDYENDRDLLESISNTEKFETISRITRSDRILNKLLYEIIIHFPEIVVRNETRSHEIKDLWVRIDLNCFFQGAAQRQHIYFTGNRTTYSFDEYFCGYSFSHLSGGSSCNQFRDFCQGSTRFAQSTAILFNEWNPTSFLLFCFQLKNYLSWESRDGGPYMYFADIHSKKTFNNTNITYNDSHLIILIHCMLSIEGYAKYIDTDFVQHKRFSVLKVKNTSSFEKLVLNAVQLCREKDRFIEITDENGRKIDEGSFNRYDLEKACAEEERHKRCFVFKDKVIGLKIETGNVNSEIKYKKTLRNNVVDDVIKILNKLINK